MPWSPTGPIWVPTITPHDEPRVGELQLLGRAAARQPFGISDPILWGTSAVALYTGGLWSAGCLEVFAADAHPLIVELFAAGVVRQSEFIGR